MLEYLYDNGCPLGDNISANAAQNGNLEMIKSAHKHGCPWNEK